MRIVIVGCAALLVAACGTEGGSAGDGDALCAGAEQLDGVYDELLGIVGDIVDMADESGRFDEEAREEAMEQLPRIADLTGEMVEAVDEMIAGADGDVRRDLEAYQEHYRSDLEAVAGADSPDEIEAAFAAVPVPPSEIIEGTQRIDDATRARCGVAFQRNPFEALVEGLADTPSPWPEVDVCTLLPTDALADVGVADTDGAAHDLPPHIEGCEWGERYGGEGAYVQLDLWDPPIPEVLEMWDRRDPIAGRTAYVEGSASERACLLAVDNGEYLVTVDLYTTPGREVSACDLAEGLAATAASSLG